MNAKTNLVNDQTVMWFGKYKGLHLKDIPNDYFSYLLQRKIAFKGIKKYAKERLSSP